MNTREELFYSVRNSVNAHFKNLISPTRAADVLLFIRRFIPPSLEELHQRKALYELKRTENHQAFCGLGCKACSALW